MNQNSKEWCWRSNLYSQAQMELRQRRSMPISWQLDAFNLAKGKVSEKGFPCPFGKRAMRNQQVWFGFVDCSTGNAYSELVDILQRYTKLYKASLHPHNLYFPLLISVRSPAEVKTLEDYNNFGWALLQHLHNLDEEPWPEKTPKNPDDSLWSFAFNGMQLFVNISTPMHITRVSRNFGPNLALVINPRENFDYVAGNTPAGNKVRQKIRERLRDYDGIEVCRNLGTYGVESNLEWKQYAIPDADYSVALSKCPIHIK
ncbi:MAG: YqcI/YcgG family protein [Acidihalobacter sp.]